MKTYKYRLHPSKNQRTQLIHTLEVCHWVYNETLATRKKAWEQEGKPLSLYDTNKMLTVWKRNHPELKGTRSQVLHNVQERVDLAFKAFFAGCRRVKSQAIQVFGRMVGTIASPSNSLALSWGTTGCDFPKLGQ